MRIAKLLVSTALLAVVAFSNSATAVGTWNGRFDGKFSPVASAKPAATPEQVKTINSMLSKIKIKLVINAKGTYKATTMVPGQPDQSSNGTWKLAGKKLTLTPSDKRPPEVGTLSANGKTLTLSLPKEMAASGVSGKAVFSRA